MRFTSWLVAFLPPACLKLFEVRDRHGDGEREFKLYWTKELERLYSLDGKPFQLLWIASHFTNWLNRAKNNGNFVFNLYLTTSS